MNTSKEFIGLLKMVDTNHLDNYTIKIILANHSIDKSRKTMRYIESRPERFKFVFIPVHASRLNIIGTFFSKIPRKMLKEIEWLASIIFIV